MNVINNKTGIIFGKFFPLHIGHVDFIQKASGLVETLYVVVCTETKRDYELFKKSKMKKMPTAKDRIRFVQQTFKYQPHIKILHLIEDGIADYPNGWLEWSLAVINLLNSKKIHVDIIFSNESQDIENYKKFFSTNSQNMIPFNKNFRIQTLDLKRETFNISATEIRNDLYKLWHFIPRNIREFFTIKVAILGGESSGKTILVDKLANYYNTTSVWEYGRDYIFEYLGGNEQALQFDDYGAIAYGQYHSINIAVKNANKLTIIDTDYITTQAFCITYEGKEHPVVNDFIKNNHFDLVFLLNNDTPWIADGMRSLGKKEDREQFQQLLVGLLEFHKISYIKIGFDEKLSYTGKYNKCIELIDKYMLQS